MKIKSLLALLLASIMLVSLFTACGVKDEPATSPELSGAPSQLPSENIEPEEPGEIVEINFWSHQSGTIDDMDKVFEKINEITEREIGVHINPTILPMADYGTQLTLAIANKEQIDLCTFTPIPASSFMALYGSGSIMDLTGLLDTYAPETKEIMGADVLAGASVGGNIYGLTSYRNMKPNGNIIYRKDALEQAGVLDKFLGMTTWAEFEEVMAAVSGLGGATYAFGGQKDINYNFCFTGTAFPDSYCYDNLGDPTYTIWTDQSGNVELSFAREDFRDMYKLIADWYAKGYYYPDSGISTDTSNINMGRNVFAGSFDSSITGSEVTKSQTIGTEMVKNMVADGLVTAYILRQFGMSVPITASEPEAAMKFINLLYTSPEIMNLITWGIEGEHYALNDKGEAAYLDGKNASTAGWHGNDFAYGQQFLLTPWEGCGIDYYSRLKADFESGIRSVYAGLAVDTSDYGALVSAISSVRNEYYNQMSHGMYTDSLYAEFLAKLDSAGIDEYIALYQSAVNDWIK